MNLLLVHMLLILTQNFGASFEGALLRTSLGIKLWTPKFELLVVSQRLNSAH